MFSTSEKPVIETASFETLETPCLILDEAKMLRNAQELRARLSGFRVRLRPHFKTPKCIEVFKTMLGAAKGPATVSTLKEAEYLLSHGITDILYAVGLAPNKLDHVFDLRRRGAQLSVILDNAEMAALAAARAKEERDPLPVLLEIDSDGHRSGLSPADPEVVRIGRGLSEGGAQLAGVLTHAGSSYDAPGEAAMIEAAERERLAVVTAAEVLRSAGLLCPTVSAGSTPTAHFARDLTGVSEVRAGVYISTSSWPVLASVARTISGSAFSRPLSAIKRAAAGPHRAPARRPVLRRGLRCGRPSLPGSRNAASQSRARYCRDQTE